MTQLLYRGQNKTIVEHKSMTRADDEQITFVHDLGPSTAVKTARLFIRENSTDDTGTAVVQIAMDELAAQWNFDTPNNGSVWIKHADTSDLNIGTYQYAIELTDQSDIVYTPKKGYLEIEWEGVWDDGTAAYLGWDTREDYAEIQTELLATVDATFLSADAEATDTSVSVVDATLFIATDTLYVALDGGGYDEVTITDVTGSVVTFSGDALSDDASKWNIVRKGV